MLKPISFSGKEGCVAGIAILAIGGMLLCVMAGIMQEWFTQKAVDELESFRRYGSLVDAVVVEKKAFRNARGSLRYALVYKIAANISGDATSFQETVPLDVYDATNLHQSVQVWKMGERVRLVEQPIFHAAVPTLTFFVVATCCGIIACIGVYYLVASKRALVLFGKDDHGKLSSD